MKLTNEQASEIKGKLSKYNVKCPICGNQHFSILEELASGIVPQTRKIIPREVGTFDYAVVVCKECGHMLNFYID